MDTTPRMLGDRYEVGEILGRGGMAEVHLARDTRLGRQVAVKMLRSDLARDPVFQARFRREAQSAAALNHPAVVAVYDTGEDAVTEANGTPGRLPYIVMEYCPGETARQLLHDSEGGGLGVGTAIDITVGVLTALEYSHRGGIIHRDIKPANVMITPTGGIKVMDFGIARAIADSAATMTQTQAVIGTAQYLSPEQARGESVDARSDLYSAGCLLYELLTGRPPFVGDSPVSVAYQHVREVPRPPSVFNPEVDDALDRIVLKALAKDREDRYPDAAAFRSDLLAARSGLPVGAPTVAMAAGAAALATQAMPTTAPTRRSPAPRTAETLLDDEEDQPPPKRRTGAWIALVIALLAVFGLAAFAASQLLGGEEPPPQVAVPNVVGEDIAGAKEAIESSGLVYAQTVAANEAPEDTVFAQDPAQGTEVDEGATVTVSVSSGPDAIAVPDVAGQTESQARQTIQNAGLQAGNVTSEDSAEVQGGRVIRTDPAAGAAADPDVPVALVVASGEVELPDVVGQSAEQARDVLVAAGFQVVQQSRPDPAPVDSVIEQNPAPGRVEQGSEVTIVVATAPPAPPPTSTPPTTSPAPSPSPTTTTSPPPD